MAKRKLTVCVAVLRNGDTMEQTRQLRKRCKTNSACTMEKPDIINAQRTPACTHLDKRAPPAISACSVAQWQLFEKMLHRSSAGFENGPRARRASKEAEKFCLNCKWPWSHLRRKRVQCLHCYIHHLSRANIASTSSSNGKTNSISASCYGSVQSESSCCVWVCYGQYPGLLHRIWLWTAFWRRKDVPSLKSIEHGLLGMATQCFTTLMSAFRGMLRHSPASCHSVVVSFRIIRSSEKWYVLDLLLWKRATT